MRNNEGMSIKQQIIDLVSKLDAPIQLAGKIGIGITEHNRYEMFKQCYSEVLKHAPIGAEIVVVDDASAKPFPEATHRFEKNVGIAVAKNKCLSLLYQRGCEHIFLLDSDTWPRTPDAWWPYINSGEPHLMYIFENFSKRPTLKDTAKIYEDSKIKAYMHPRGCMLYYHRSVLDAVGGMDPVFGRWGFEHPSHSDRIFMAGLTSFRYMDVADSSGLWFNDDEENNNVNSSVSQAERQKQVAVNEKLYNERKFTSNYIPFLDKQNILLTCYFSGVNDTQRAQSFAPNSQALQPLIASLKNTKLVVLHDCLDDDSTDKVEFVRVDTSINPYFQRWISYRKYLMANQHEIDNVFCIDGTDVEVLKEPDWDSLGDFIYTGDEAELLDNASGWMRSQHKSPAVQDMLNRHGKQWQMLNAGILGGSVENIIEFTRALIDFYCFAEQDAFKLKVPNAGTTDMGAFNYVARNVFGDRIRHGGQVCTRFKANERNDYSWFKHK